MGVSTVTLSPYFREEPLGQQRHLRVAVLDDTSRAAFRQRGADVTFDPNARLDTSEVDDQRGGGRLGSVPDGSSAQQQHWFSVGYQFGDPNGCDTFQGTI